MMYKEKSEYWQPWVVSKDLKGQEFPCAQDSCKTVLKAGDPYWGVPYRSAMFCPSCYETHVLGKKENDTEETHWIDNLTLWSWDQLIGRKLQGFGVDFDHLKSVEVTGVLDKDTILPSLVLKGSADEDSLPLSEIKGNFKLIGTPPPAPKRIEEWDDRLAGKSAVCIPLQGRPETGGEIVTLLRGDPNDSTLVYIRKSNGEEPSESFGIYHYMLKEGEPTLDAAYYTKTKASFIGTATEVKVIPRVLNETEIVENWKTYKYSAVSKGGYLTIEGTTGDTSIWINGEEITDPLTKLYMTNSAFRSVCDRVAASIGESLETIKRAFNSLLKAFGPPLNEWANRIGEICEQLNRFEVTHSCVFQFPDDKGNPGETIRIPSPEGPEWLSETIYDEWAKRRKGQRSPQIYVFEEDQFQICFPGFDVGSFDEDYLAGVTHDSARMLGHEYSIRIDDEEPRLLSLTRHYRIKPQEFINPPFPLLPSKSLSGFWVEDHELVYTKKRQESSEYPGADKRAPEKKWSGVWLYGHAPKVGK